MAHTYVVASITQNGSVATIAGTVDGVPVTAVVSVQSVPPTAILAQTFLAQAMLAALPPASPIPLGALIGSFTL